MSEAWQVKRGNTSIQKILIKDKDGNTVTNMSLLTDATFVIKESKLGAALITKTKASGIDIDTPSTGYVQITLSPTDTKLKVKKYYMALELTWSPTVKYEIKIKKNGVETDIFEVLQDII